MRNMIPDKELYEDIIKFLDLLQERKIVNYYRAAVILGGARWVRVSYWLQEYTGEAFIYYARGMDYILHNTDHLTLLRDFCKKEINRINQQENDRLIDLQYKIKGIIFGRISLIISGLAFLLSLWVALRQAGIF
ncbi:MAG: hypothetical protein HDS35_01075 [Bacteroides sp.]|nr:hypothetical protein [Bacteroides sp.]